jgi:hypothetical protein
MPFWSKKKPADAAHQRASWIAADANPFGVPVLDLISITGGMISTSTDPLQAEMSMSWSSKLVKELPTAFVARRTIACELHFPTDGDVPDGWLFTPSKMEEKWAIAYRDQRIWMIRSWTGEVKAVAGTRRGKDEIVVERIELADDGLSTFGDAVATIDWMIRTHALGQRLPLPVDDEGAQMLERVPLSVFAPFGSMALCAAKSWSPPPAPPLRATSDLIVAVRTERIDLFDDLAKKDPIDARSAVAGLTALHVAAIKGSFAMVERLLDLGASPNVLADRRASVFVTALVHGAPIEVMKLLAARGADVKSANADGFGALHALAEVNRPDVLGWLLSLGLDIEARTNNGHTPLHIAAALGHVEALRTLLEAGADVSARGPSGETARDIAIAEKKPESVAALER